MASDLHRDAIVVDSLMVSKWSPDVFRSIHAGGVTTMNATCAVWENFRDTMDNIGQWHRWFARHPDLLMPVRRTADIIEAKRAGRLGVILGFQNGAPFEDNPDFVRLFKSLGVGICQITYNNQNFIGSGAYETVDSGLSDFGRWIVDEMNACGMAVDLSHVGPKTSADAIAHSTKPVCFSHANPKSLKDHVRNKDDVLLRALADKGGYVGVNLFPLFMPDQANREVRNIVILLDYLIDLIGEDQVGIGTDLTEGHGAEFWHWITHLNGRGESLLEVPEDQQGMLIRTGREWWKITEALEEAGYSESRIRKIVGGNFMRFLKDVWGE